MTSARELGQMIRESLRGYTQLTIPPAPGNHSPPSHLHIPSLSLKQTPQRSPKHSLVVSGIGFWATSMR